jgi:hypothetical protein
MNYSTSILPGIAIICVSAFLFWLSRITQPSHNITVVGQDQRYLLESQRKLRFRMSLLLLLVGFAIMSTGLIEDRRVWAVSWLLIMCSLLILLAMAMWDALRLITIYRRAIPQISQETLGRRNPLKQEMPTTPTGGDQPSSSSE